jgi:hypothetical protein
MEFNLRDTTPYCGQTHNIEPRSHDDLPLVSTPPRIDPHYLSHSIFSTIFVTIFVTVFVTVSTATTAAYVPWRPT